MVPRCECTAINWHLVQGVPHLHAKIAGISSGTPTTLSTGLAETENGWTDTDKCHTHAFPVPSFRIYNRTAETWCCLFQKINQKKWHFPSLIIALSPCMMSWAPSCSCVWQNYLAACGYKCEGHRGPGYLPWQMQRKRHLHQETPAVLMQLWRQLRSAIGGVLYNYG